MRCVDSSSSTRDRSYGTTISNEWSNSLSISYLLQNAHTHTHSLAQGSFVARRKLLRRYFESQKICLPLNFAIISFGLVAVVVVVQSIVVVAIDDTASSRTHKSTIVTVHCWLCLAVINDKMVIFRCVGVDVTTLTRTPIVFAYPIRYRWLLFQFFPSSSSSFAPKKKLFVFAARRTCVCATETYE